MSTEPSPAPKRWLYLIAAVSVAAIAVAAVFAATHTDPARLQTAVDPNHLPSAGQAPPVTVGEWINSPPLSPTSLAGKVVLYDFWTYSCINCVRTFPYVRSWYDRYQADGLVVIGIHSPEFDFEHNHGNVRRATKELAVTWPVALDDNMSVWNAFLNNAWPAHFIADRRGQLRYHHAGEGSYDQTEDVIRSLLGVKPDSPRAASPNSPTAGEPQPVAADITPETYLGVLRGTEEVKAGPATYPDSGTPRIDTAGLVGPWTGADEYLQADAASSAVVLHYQAREVNLVLAPPAGGPLAVRIELDGKALPANERTAQTMVDAQGQTFVQVTDADMYRLVLSPAVEGHVLRITAGGTGLQVYDFTFGS